MLAPEPACTVPAALEDAFAFDPPFGAYAILTPKPRGNIPAGVWYWKLLKPPISSPYVYPDATPPVACLPEPPEIP